MLDRVAEEQMLEFCVAQRASFSPDAWWSKADAEAVSRDLAVVALFLAGGDWYGHQAELEAVAEKLRPGCVGHFSELVTETRFECGRFGASLKRALGMK